MITTQQLEAFWERYQREGVPNDLSMQAFCSMHNVPYNCFERHVRKRSKFKNIQPVIITDKPEDIEMEMETESSVATQTTKYIHDRLDEVCAEGESTPDKVRILVSIKMSNGFQIHRSNIDYRTLLGLVEKMEALC